MQTRTGQKLTYFKNCTPKEIKQLEETFAEPIETLERKIAEHKTIYHLYLIKNGITTIIYTPYLYFQFKKINVGLDSFVTLFKDNVAVPDAIKYAIGGTTATINNIFWTLAINPFKESRGDTLYYLKQKPIKEWISNALNEIYHTPKKALSDLSQYLFLNGISIIFSTTIGSSIVLGFSDEFKQLDKTISWAITIFLFYFNLNFIRKYTFRQFQAGLYDFFINNKDNTISLWSEFKRYHFATPLQTLCQGLTAIVCRSYPLHYTLASDTKDLYGWYFPQEFALSIALFYNICVLYPVSAKYYLGPQKAVQDLIPSENIDAITHDMVIKLRQKNGINYLCKADSSLYFILALNGAAMGYLSYTMLTPLLNAALDESYTSSILSIALGMITIVTFLYHAEKNRVIANHILREFSPIAEHKQEIPHSKSDYIADFINIAAQASTAFSNIGLYTNGSRTLGSIVILTQIIAAGNFVQFNKVNMRNTVKEWGNSIYSFFKRESSPIPALEEECYTPPPSRSWE